MQLYVYSNKLCMTSTCLDQTPRHKIYTITIYKIRQRESWARSKPGALFVPARCCLCLPVFRVCFSYNNDLAHYIRYGVSHRAIIMVHVYVTLGLECVAHAPRSYYISVTLICLKSFNREDKTKKSNVLYVDALCEMQFAKTPIYIE